MRTSARAASISAIDGVVWTVLSSGHLASFDRKQVQGAAQRPATAVRQALPGRLDALSSCPARNSGASRTKGSANHAYYIWVDRYNTLGLGANVPIASANGGESLLALVERQIRHPARALSARLLHQERRRPHRRSDGRLERRGIWTTSGTRANFHSEGGTEAYPKVFKVQMRPDPLAH